MNLCLVDWFKPFEQQGRAVRSLHSCAKLLTLLQMEESDTHTAVAKRHRNAQLVPSRLVYAVGLDLAKGSNTSSSMHVRFLDIGL
jgi:hypothetical protein